MGSVGVVFQPAPEFSASLDWWTINRENSIDVLTLDELVENFEFFPERFIRDGSGRLVAIDRSWINTGQSKTQGLEVVLRGAGQMLGGNLAAGLDGTYLLKKKEKVVPGADFEDRVGEFSFSGDLGLRWKHNAFISYGQAPWTVVLTQLFRSGYENQELPGVETGSVNPPGLVERVDDYIIYNLAASFDVSEAMRMTLGIKNLLDTDPPFAITYDSNTGSGSSWDPRVADPRGRAFTVNVDVKF
jgi:iron complex outermembrane receptor protein